MQDLRYGETDKGISASSCMRKWRCLFRLCMLSWKPADGEVAFFALAFYFLPLTDVCIKLLLKPAASQQDHHKIKSGEWRNGKRVNSINPLEFILSFTNPPTYLRRHLCLHIPHLLQMAVSLCCSRCIQRCSLYRFCCFF